MDILEEQSREEIYPGLDVEEVISILSDRDGNNTNKMERFMN